MLSFQGRSSELPLAPVQENSMSNSPSPMQVFESCLEASYPNSGRCEQVDALIRETLHIAHRMVVVADSGHSGLGQQGETDLWDDVGTFMLRTSAIMAAFTENIQEADLVHQAALDKFRRAKERNHLAEYSVLQSLDRKKKKLQQTSDLSSKYHQDLQALWTCEDAAGPNKEDISKPKSSRQEVSESGGGGKTGLRRTLPAGGQRDPRSSNDHDSDSEPSDDSDDELFQALDLRHLANRGKGVYYCPKGAACKKGGVDKHGNLQEFERNSAFVQHCNKHRKPFRCTEENCPNPAKKRRFARKDGLERHKEKVSHAPPGSVRRESLEQTSIKMESP